jgi:hypothetical protein
MNQAHKVSIFGQFRAIFGVFLALKQERVSFLKHKKAPKGQKGFKKAPKGSKRFLKKHKRLKKSRGSQIKAPKSLKMSQKAYKKHTWQP